MIGHNPKANQLDFLADDFQEVAALLRELPRVAAPMDFNASLKARIAAATVEASEFAGVTALVKELPRVAAPADFDFKLRARIAQAKAEQQKSSAGWLAGLFGRTFSWVQASAAMAAVAIVVSVVTFGVLRSDIEVNPTAPATVAQGFNPTPSLAPTQQPTMSNDPQPTAIQPPASDLRVPAGRPRTIKSGTRLTTSVVIPDVRMERLPARGDDAGLVASKVMIKHQSGEARMVNLSEYNLGLQTAHLRSTPTAPRTVETAAVNIY